MLPNSMNWRKWGTWPQPKVGRLQGIVYTMVYGIKVRRDRLSTSSWNGIERIQKKSICQFMEWNRENTKEIYMPVHGME